MRQHYDRHSHFKTTEEATSVCQHYDTDIDTSRQQMKLSLCVSIMTQTLTLQDNKWSHSCMSALWHRLWHFKKRDEVIPVYQHYDTDIDTSRQQMKLSLCVSIMTQTLTLQDNIGSYPCVSIIIQTLTLQENKWSYPCVSIMTHTLTLQNNKWSYPCQHYNRHWHFKKTNEVISVCQHYDTDIDTSRQQKKLSLCVSIMTQTLTLQDNRRSYPCMSALWQTFTFLDNRFNFPFGIFTGFLSLLVNFTTCDVTSRKQMLYLFVCLMVFNATFNNISVI